MIAQGLIGLLFLFIFGIILRKEIVRVFHSIPQVKAVSKCAQCGATGQTLHYRHHDIFQHMPRVCGKCWRKELEEFNRRQASDEFQKGVQRCLQKMRMKKRARVLFQEEEQREAEELAYIERIRVRGPR